MAQTHSQTSTGKNATAFFFSYKKAKDENGRAKQFLLVVNLLRLLVFFRIAFLTLF